MDGILGRFCSYKVSRLTGVYCILISLYLVPPQHHQSLVSQIVEQIESSILSMWNSDEILHSVRKDNIQSLNTMIDAENRPVSNTHMNQLQFEEVQYYLKSYGTHKQMLEFLVKYKLVKRACLYVQSQVSIIIVITNLSQIAHQVNTTQFVQYFLSII